MQHTVLFYESHSGFFNGAQQSLYLLLQHLNRKRFRPIFVGPEEGPLTDRLAAAGIPTIILRPNAPMGRYGGALLHEGIWSKSRLALSYLAYAWRLQRILKHEGVDLVHCNSIRSLLTVGPVARIAGVPLIWHLRLNLDLGWWNSVGLKLADKVIVVADNLREHFPTGPGDPGKFVMVHNGLDSTVFGARTDASEVRAELGIEPGWRAVGMTGSLTPRKGQLELLRAASSVIQTQPQTKFVIVGEPAGSAEDHAYVERLCAFVVVEGLERHVTFTGWRADVAQVLRGLDLFVLPSQNEGLPRSILEAMATSLPVVATRVGGNAELVVHGQTGLLVPAQDPVALAGAITELLREPERARVMGRRGRQRIETTFSLEATTRGIEEVIDVVLDGRHCAVRDARDR